MGKCKVNKLKTITKIEWDTDGEEVTLPDSVQVPAVLDDEAVADYLSDIYGWCVTSLCIESA